MSAWRLYKKMMTTRNAKSDWCQKNSSWSQARRQQQWQYSVSLEGSEERSEEEPEEEEPDAEPEEEADMAETDQDLQRIFGNNDRNQMSSVTPGQASNSDVSRVPATTSNRNDFTSLRDVQHATHA